MRDESSWLELGGSDCQRSAVATICSGLRDAGRNSPTIVTGPRPAVKVPRRASRIFESKGIILSRKCGLMRCFQKCTAARQYGARFDQDSCRKVSCNRHRELPSEAYNDLRCSVRDAALPVMQQPPQATRHSSIPVSISDVPFQNSQQT
jgi:hypothetical protein